MVDVLSSWKEIAHYFGKGVRTVQRWEKTLDLPVRRPPGAASNVVLARKSDLDDWMQRKGAMCGDVRPTDSHASLLTSIASLEAEVAQLAHALGQRTSPACMSGTAAERLTAITATVSRLASVTRASTAA